MDAQRRPRCGLMVASSAVVVLAAVAAAVISTWALFAVPFAFIVGACAFLGLALRETWDALDQASGDDAGRGPAGMVP